MIKYKININQNFLNKLFNDSTITIYQKEVYIKPNFFISYDKSILTDLEAILNISLKTYERDFEVNVRHPKDSVIIRFNFEDIEQLPNILNDDLINELKSINLDYEEYIIDYPQTWFKTYKNSPEWVREQAINNILN